MNKRILKSALCIALLLPLVNSCSKDKSDTELITDVDGNKYHTVTIGTQVWMVENLKTTRYNDSTEIQLVTDNTQWQNLTTGVYCWYNNNETYKSTYGTLYNWYAASTDKLCPAGWHVPTDDEWTELTAYLLGEDVAGGKMKETGTINWSSPNIDATDESGFKALPGGCRNWDGTFDLVKEYGFWWSSTSADADDSWSRYLKHDNSTTVKYGANNKDGLSVRCIQDPINQ
jgi:uncharacterized protein (TIGR02145 family)